MKNIKFLAALCFAMISLFYCQIASAGAQDGPFLIFLNLSDNKAIDEIINSHIKAKDKCLPVGLLVSPSPPWIGKELVAKAMISGDKKSILKLDGLLKKPYDNYISDGFDGIVIYDEKHGPKFSGLVRGWKMVGREKVTKISDEKNIWEAFCVLTPPITRPI